MTGVELTFYSSTSAMCTDLSPGGISENAVHSIKIKSILSMDKLQIKKAGARNSMNTATPTGHGRMSDLLVPGPHAVCTGVDE